MSLSVKISLGLTIAAVLYFIMSYSIGTQAWILKVKYQGDIVEYMTSSGQEVDDLELKSKNDCLYFDGQTFFSGAPSNAIRPITKAYIVDRAGTVINGDVDIISFIGILAMIIIVGGGISFMIYVSEDDTEYPRDYHY